MTGKDDNLLAVHSDGCLDTQAEIDSLRAEIEQLVERLEVSEAKMQAAELAQAELVRESEDLRSQLSSEKSRNAILLDRLDVEQRHAVQHTRKLNQVVTELQAEVQAGRTEVGRFRERYSEVCKALTKLKESTLYLLVTGQVLLQVSWKSCYVSVVPVCIEARGRVCIHWCGESVLHQLCICGQ